MGDKTKNGTADTSSRKATSDRLRKLWADPDYRERMRSQSKRLAEDRLRGSPAHSVTPGATPAPTPMPSQPEPSDKSEQHRAAVLTRWADRQAPPDNAAEIIHQAAQNGCTVGEICKALGVGRMKFREWLDSPVHGPALQAAMAEGKAIEHDRLVGLLMDAAVGGKVKGSLVAMLFLLKTRHGYQEGATLVQNSVSINYQLPAPMTPEDYMKMVAPAAGQGQHVPASDVRKLIDRPKELTRE